VVRHDRKPAGKMSRALGLAGMVMQAIYNGHTVVPGEQVRIRKAHWPGVGSCAAGPGWSELV